MAVTVGRCRATGTTTRAVIATGWARRGAAITLITGSLVYATKVRVSMKFFESGEHA
jgi:hypothetical protein